MIHKLTNFKIKFNLYYLDEMPEIYGWFCDHQKHYWHNIYSSVLSPQVQLFLLFVLNCAVIPVIALTPVVVSQAPVVVDFVSLAPVVIDVVSQALVIIDIVSLASFCHSCR